VSEATAELKVLLEIRDAMRNLDDIKAKTQDTEKGVDKSFSVMKGAAATFVGFLGSQAVVKAFGVIKDVVAEGIGAAIEHEKTWAGLRKSMELAGDASDGALNAMSEFADEMEARTLFDDKEIANGLKLALSFGTSAEEARKLVEAAGDLSAATGQDLSSSIQVLGRSLTGVLGPLDQLIPATKDLTREQLAAFGAIDAVLDRFGGSAKAETETFAGSVNKVADAWGDFTKQIGFAITESELLKDAIDLLAEGIKKITPTPIDETKKALQKAKDEAIELAREANRVFQASGGDPESPEGNKLRDAIDELYARPLESFKEQVPLHMAAIREFDEQRVRAEEKTQTRLQGVRDDAARKEAEKNAKKKAPAQAAAPSIADLRRASDTDYQVYQPEQNLLDDAAVDARLEKMGSGLADAFAASLAEGDGASAARAFFQAGGAAIAESFVPGLGKLVGPVLGKLMDGPEATKQFIREFIEAVPDIMVAVAEAMPAVAEAFVDVMVNKGGAERIALAMVKTFSGASSLEYAGKRFGEEAGLNFNDNLNWDNLDTTISMAFEQGAARMHNFNNNFNSSVTNFGNRAHDFSAAFRAGWDRAPGAIKEGFNAGWLDTKENVETGFSNAWLAVQKTVEDAWETLALPTIPEPDWLANFGKWVDKLVGWTGVGGGGGGDGNPIKKLDPSTWLTGGDDGSMAIAYQLTLLYDLVNARLPESVSIKWNDQVVGSLMLSANRTGKRVNG